MPAAARQARFQGREGTGVNSSERRRTVVFEQSSKLCCGKHPGERKSFAPIGRY
jgi:hypothetical protein